MIEETKLLIKSSQKDQFQELNDFIVDYFQEWLDLNSLAQFKAQVNTVSRLADDWLTFETIYKLIKFYSRQAVLTMAEVMRSKWIRNKNVSKNREFAKFKHVSALMIHIFQVVASSAKQIINRDMEIE